MTPTPISDFDDVILFELQKKVQIGKLASLSFGEIWKASADAAPNFSAPIDPTVRRSAFIARMMQAIEVLQKSELISVATNYGDKVDSVMLTESGINHVSKIVYSGQQKMRNITN